MYHKTTVQYSHFKPKNRLHAIRFEGPKTSKLRETQPFPAATETVQNVSSLLYGHFDERAVSKSKPFRCAPARAEKLDTILYAHPNSHFYAVCI